MILTRFYSPDNTTSVLRYICHTSIFFLHIMKSLYPRAYTLHTRPLTIDPNFAKPRPWTLGSIVPLPKTRNPLYPTCPHNSDFIAVSRRRLYRGEVLRPEVGERLALWVAAAGGGQRAAGEEFGRRQAEVLGELRGQYAAHLRRAVAGVAAAGPSLIGALRAAAVNPPPHVGASRSSLSDDGEEDDDGGGGGENGNGGGGGGGGGVEASGEAASGDELDTLVAPILAHIRMVVSGLRRSIPQCRALVGVLRGLWSLLAAEALKFVEEDLRQRSSWRLRLMATGASERISSAMSAAIRDALGHDVKEKDLDPPAPMKRLGEFIGGAANESVSVY